MAKKSDLAIAYSTQKHNKKKKMAEGGAASPTKTATSTSSPTKTDTSTSTTGNKTKTGGSNPGGASTGGAGTVTITTGKNPPKAINISNVGGKTDAKNHGGMDPGDEDDKMKMALGGAVPGPTHSKGYSRNSGTQPPKPDDTRYPDSETMSDQWSKGNPPARKPDDQRRPKSAYLDTNDWSDGMKPSRAPFAEGGEVTSKPNAPRPGQASYESEDLNARAARNGMTLAQMAERHEQEAAKFRMYADGGIVEPSGRAQETQYPGTKPRVPDDDRRPKDAYIDTDYWSDLDAPSRKPFAHGGMVDEDDRPGSVAEDIMRKRTRDRAPESEGSDESQVDLEANSEESPNMADEYNYDANGKEQYDDSQISKQPRNSNEKGDAREDSRSDKNDMVSQIIKKLRSLRR